MNNQKKSGGPQTPEGKLVASRNSLKTGVYSKLIVLPGEDESQFRDLEAQFNHDFAPRDIAESAMVHELAILTWKKIRLEQLEYRVIKHSLLEEIDGSDLRYSAKFIVREGSEWLLGRMDDLTKEFVGLYANQQLHARAFLGRPAGEPPLDALKIRHPDLYRKVNELAEDYDLPDQTHHGIRDAISPDGYPIQTFARFALERIIEEADDVIWAYENKDQIHAAIQKVRDSRLMILMKNETTSRANDDLNRNFSRTLAELRKQQHWRYQREAIDITNTINESRAQIENGGTKSPK